MPSIAQRIIQIFLGAENARDWKTWESLLHREVVYEVVGREKVVKGASAYLAHMKRVYAELPDWRFELPVVAATGSVVVVEFLGHGHFTGKYDGRRYEEVSLNLRAVCVFRVRSKLVVHVREYLDQQGYEQQMRTANATAAQSDASQVTPSK